MKELKNYVVKFVTNGFTPGKDISQEEYENVISEYISMYDVFSNYTNQILDKINTTWEKYQEVKKKEEELLPDYPWARYATRLLQAEMEITDKTTYSDWVEKWYKNIVEVIDIMAMTSRFKLMGNLHRDGELPVYGACFRDKKEWTIDFVLTEA